MIDLLAVCKDAMFLTLLAISPGTSLIRDRGFRRDRLKQHMTICQYNLQVGYLFVSEIVSCIPGWLQTQ